MMTTSTSRYSLKPINIFSKPVVQILLWTTLTTSIYFAALEAWPQLVLRSPIKLFWRARALQTGLTCVLILYPIGGFVGDACLGRYKTVISGLVLVMLSTLISSFGSILTLVIRGSKVSDSANAHVHKTVTALDVVSILLFVVGISAFSSNINQFGLDQLIDKPSVSLGVFVHWLVWAIKLGGTLIQMIIVVASCIYGNPKKIMEYFLHSLPICCLVLLVILLLAGYFTRHQFNRDRVKYNPYKMIFKVLNFARKNKYPVGPVSAFTYCDNFRPSRLDYAKERYGGPFTTSDVEDVKAFKNVFLVLLALGPIFMLNLPIAQFFKSFSSHTGFRFPLGVQNTTCKSLSPEIFSGLIGQITIPVYIWLLYSVFRNSRPKILHRLVLLVFLYTGALVSMLVVDLTGHLRLFTGNQPQPKCMFVNEQEASHTTLNMHWTVLIIPGILSECHSLIMATALEFVSAQSPHTMIGVLVGTFYAFIGIFRFVGTSFFVPFAIYEIWGDGYLGQQPPVVSCGFGFYLVCLTVAVIGFISLITAVKRYKYRRRDEEPYSQACVEEIFARRIAYRCKQIGRAGYEELSD